MAAIGNRPKLFGQIEYCIIEPSARRQDWQRETIETFRAARPLVFTIQRFKRFERFNGIIF